MTYEEAKQTVDNFGIEIKNLSENEDKYRFFKEHQSEIFDAIWQMFEEDVWRNILTK